MSLSYLIVVHLTMSEYIHMEMGLWKSISWQTLIELSICSYKNWKFYLFRIRNLDHVSIGCESKDNIEVDHLSKDIDSTSESGLLNGWVRGSIDKATLYQLRNNQDVVPRDKV